MRRLDRLTNESKQRYTIPMDEGGSFVLELFYLPRIQMWMANISEGDFVLNGILVTAFPNILRQYKNLISFGIACISEDGLDPRYIDDFTTGRVALYVLNQQDVEIIEQEIFS